MKWWQTTGILESEARKISTRARTAYDYLLKQKAEREKAERERMAGAVATKERTLGEWRESGAKWFPATPLALAGIRQEEERRREGGRQLEEFGIEPTSLNIRNQLEAMYGEQPEGRYNWAERVTAEARAEEFETRTKEAEKEAEAEAKDKARIRAKLLKEELITFDTPQNEIEDLVNQRLATKRAEDAFAEGDIEKAKQYKQVSNWWNQYMTLSPEEQQAVMEGTVTPPSPPTETATELPWYKRALYGVAGAVETIFIPFTAYGIEQREMFKRPTMADLAAMTPEEREKYIEKRPLKAQWAEILPGGMKHEEYKELPWYQQLMYEAPAWVIASAAPGAAAGKAALAGKTGLAAKIGRGVLTPPAAVETGIAKGVGVVARVTVKGMSAGANKALNLALSRNAKYLSGLARRPALNPSERLLQKILQYHSNWITRKSDNILKAQMAARKASGAARAETQRTVTAEIKLLTEGTDSTTKTVDNIIKVVESGKELTPANIGELVAGTPDDFAKGITDIIGKPATAEVGKEAATPEIPAEKVAIPKIEEVRALARDKNYTLTKVVSPKQVEQWGQYRIVGKKGAATEGTKVFAKDLTQAREFIETGEFAPKTTAATEFETVTGEIPEGEVTVEGLEPVKAVRMIQTNYSKRIVTYAETKKQLVEYVNKHLPLPVRGKMLASVKNVKTEAGLSKAIAKADAYAEQYAQKTLKATIGKELKRTIPKKRAGLLRGKFGADIQVKLDEVRAKVGMDRDLAREQIASNIEKFESGQLGYDDMVESNELLAVSGINGMSADELGRTLEYIKTLKTTGRTVRSEAKAIEKERIEGIKKEIINVLTGGKELKPGALSVSGVELEAKKTLKDQIANWNDWQYGWDNLLDKLSKLDKGSKPYQSTLSKFGSQVHIARGMQDAGTEKYLTQLKVKLSEIYHVDKTQELSHILNGLQQEKVNLGTFKNADGVEVSLNLTKEQIMKKYQELLDPTLDDTFKNGMKWTDEMISAVNNSLTPQEKAWADYQIEFFQDYYDSINPIYRELYGIDLPHNPYYSPIARDIEANIPENVLLAKDMGRYAAITNGSLKSRVKNRVTLKFNDATGVLMNHIIQMEHFKAWAYTMRDMRRMFGSKDVRTAIRQYHGRDILKHIDGYLNDLARDGIDRAKINRTADFLRWGFTRGVLGLKPIISLKQIPSTLAYTTEMPIGDFFSGVADFWKAPIANYRKLLKLSPYLRERFGSGFERDIRFALQKGWAKQLAKKGSFTDSFMALIRTGDKFAVTQGTWAKYLSEMKAGKSSEEAINLADQATKRTQPSFTLESLSPLQKGGSFYKLATMFQNQPNKYFRIVADNARNLQFGRGSKGKAIYNILLAWVVLPCIFQYIADAFQFKGKRQARAGILGPLNYVLIAGQLVQSIYGWLTDEPFPYQASPVFSTAKSLEYGFKKVKGLANTALDPMKDIETDDVIKAVEHFGKAAGQVLGLPTPYAIQVERGIRDADLRQLIFSEYALRKEETPETKALRKLQDIYAKEVCGKDNWTKLDNGEQDYFWKLRPDLKD